MNDRDNAPGRVVIGFVAIAFAVAGCVVGGPGSGRQGKCPSPTTSTDTCEMPSCSAPHELDMRKYYPAEAKEKGIEGTVWLRIVIDTEGRMASVEVLKDPGGGLGQAAVSMMPVYSCTPGKMNGIPVNTAIPFRVIFQLN